MRVHFNPFLSLYNQPTKGDPEPQKGGVTEPTSLADLVMSDLASGDDGKKGKVGDGDANLDDGKGSKGSKGGEDGKGEKPKDKKKSDPLAGLLGLEDDDDQEDTGEKKPDGNKAEGAKGAAERFKSALELEPGSMASSPAQKFSTVKASLKKAVDELSAREQEVEQLKAAAAKGAGAVEVNDETVKSHPTYKKLEEEFNKQIELVERVQLESSPRFQQKFDGVIKKKIEALDPILKSMSDPAQREELTASIRTLVSIDPSPAGDEAFYKAIKAHLKKDWLDSDDRSEIRKRVTEIREAAGEKMRAVEDWKKTKTSLSESEGADIETAAKLAEQTFTQIRAKIDANPDRASYLEKVRGAPELKYDEITKPWVGRVQAEIAAAVRAGKPTPQLLNILNLAVEAPHIQFMNNALVERLKGQEKMIKAYRAEIKRAKMKDPFASTADNGGEEKQTKQGGSSGILDTLDEITSGN